MQHQTRLTMRTLALISTASALLHSQAPLRSSTPLGAIDITNRGYVRIDTEKETVAHPKAAPVLDEVSLRKCVDEAVQDADWHRPISVLGSTGSIGTQTLDFCRARPDRFSVIALCAGANYKLLATQVAEFRRTVTTVGISDGSKLEPLKEALKAAGVDCASLEIYGGADAATACATAQGADVVVTGVVGTAGLPPTVAAIEAGKDIALANKETLIAGGPAILPLLKHGTAMTPADSEHSAIFQALQGVPPNGMRKVILTASGGAFRDLTAAELADKCENDAEWVRAKATTHPNWDMGAKITVDSATMMNKGLEVIEAHYLFGADYDDIDVVVHPQSIIHSAIETQDNSVIAQLGWPDMRLPLLYSVSWPHRVRMPQDQWEPRFDLVELGRSSMTIQAAASDDNDNARRWYGTAIRLLRTRVGFETAIGIDAIAYAAGRVGGTMTGCLNAANEMANEMFREGAFEYLDIPRVIEAAMEAHKADFIQEPSLDEIIEVDLWARRFVKDSASAKKEVFA